MRIQHAKHPYSSPFLLFSLLRQRSTLLGNVIFHPRQGGTRRGWKAVHPMMWHNAFWEVVFETKQTPKQSNPGNKHFYFYCYLQRDFFSEANLHLPLIMYHHGLAEVSTSDLFSASPTFSSGASCQKHHSRGRNSYSQRNHNILPHTRQPRGRSINNSMKHLNLRGKKIFFERLLFAACSLTCVTLLRNVA